MKINIEYSVIRIIKKNLFFIASILGVIVLFVFGILFFTNEYQANNIKIETLQSDLKDLKERKAVVELQQKTIRENVNLDEINSILSQLIPNEEDYFSVIAALEKLSQQTGFVIASYTINLVDSQTGKLSLSVEGVGDSSNFLEFLKNYNFGGGRLITIENIEFDQKAFAGSKISLNVYSGKASTPNSLSRMSEEDKRFLDAVIQKVQLNFTPAEATSLEYPTKTNPF